MASVNFLDCAIDNPAACTISITCLVDSAPAFPNFFISSLAFNASSACFKFALTTLATTCITKPSALPRLPKLLAKACAESAADSMPPLNLLNPPSAPPVNALPKLATLFTAAFAEFSRFLLAFPSNAFVSTSAFCASVIPSVKLRVASVAEETPLVMDSKAAVILVSCRKISSSELIMFS